jgi:hypothetical protein
MVLPNVLKSLTLFFRIKPLVTNHQGQSIDQKHASTRLTLSLSDFANLGLTSGPTEVHIEIFYYDATGDQVWRWVPHLVSPNVRKSLYLSLDFFPH